MWSLSNQLVKNCTHTYTNKLSEEATALTKSPWSVWQAVSYTVYFCWSPNDGWKPWKLQVTFRKSFFWWWKCNNRTCQLPHFWGRRGWNGACLSSKIWELCGWIKSKSISLSLHLSPFVHLVFNGLQSSPLSTFFHLCVCVPLFLGSLCLHSACILVTAQHISYIQSRAGFSATRLYHLALWMQMENPWQGLQTHSSFPKTMTWELLPYPTK